MSFSALRRLLIAVLVGTLGVLALLTVPGVSSATSVRQDKVVSDNPANWTPHALDNSVQAIAQVGDQIVSGGDFTQVVDRNRTDVINQPNVFAFNATTGVINTNFRPQLTGGRVEAIAPHPDGDKVWVAGTFSEVNGVRWPKLALLSLTDGSLVTSFAKPAIDGKVLDMAVVGNRLILSGTWTTIKGVNQGRLAALNINDGSYDPFISLPFTGQNNGGVTAVAKFAVSADGTRLVAIGNFTSVAGQARGQVAVLDLNGSSATLANWATARYPNVCANAFDTYLRDVDIDPDGSYFVIVTTGAYRSGTLCDTAARWELRATGTALQPTWIDYTGGDTEYSVAITGAAVYVGGHQRWHNNSFRADAAGPGAVSRQGIAALDPANGLPFSWDPSRDRGVGAFALTVTDAGLWVGSDTDRIGDFEYHGRISFFPLLGGRSIPRPVTGTLPGRLLSLGTTGLTPIAARAFDGTTAGPATQIPGAATAAKAATMISSQMYLARSNGNFEVSSWDGTTLGAATVVPDLAITAWRTDVTNMTGMFFRQGRLYYTVSNSSNLFYRYFTPESGVIGADRFTASGSVTGLNYSQVRSMVAVDNTLYWVQSTTGNLNKTTIVNGIPAANTTTTVSGPATGIDWRQGPLTLEAFAEAVPYNAPPLAVANAVCEDLTCHFTSVGSQDPDGALVERVWDFGDGSFDEGAAVDHTYAVEGTYTAKLTVRDADGVDASTTVQVKPNSPPVAALTATCDALICQVDGTASTEASTFTWNFGDGATATGATATHTYAAAGTSTITLTVSDDEGATASATKTVTVVAPTTQIDFVQSTSAIANGTAVHVNTPAQTVANDGLVLIASGNRSDVTYGAPGAGWTEVRRIADNDLVTIVWQRVADETDAGKQVQVTAASATTKLDLQLLVYRGTDRTTPVIDSAAAVEPGNSASHTTPTIAAPQGAVLLYHWADKSSATTTWTPPQGVTVRQQSVGTGTGRVTSLTADQAPLAQEGTVGGLTATADTAVGKATMFSIILRPRA